MPDSQSITRTIMDNVSSSVAATFYVTVFLACAAAAIGFAMRAMKYRQSRHANLTRNPPRLFDGLREKLALHHDLMRDPFAGIAHLLIMIGFVILFIGTCLVFLEHDTPLHFFYGRFYLIASCIIDLGGVAFIIGLTMFLTRRLRNVKKRILRQWWVLSLTLLLLAIGISGFLLEAARIAQTKPSFEVWSVVGYPLAVLLRACGVSGERAVAWHRSIWIGHAMLCVAFFALLPWRFFGHIVYSAISRLVHRPGPISALQTYDVTRLTDAQSPGAVTWQDFHWRDLLQADACTTCGQCNDACPAAAAGKPLNPRDVVLALRKSMQSPNLAVASLLADNVLWSCTTCGACNETCPVKIDVYDKIVELRRGRVEQGDAPAAAVQVFESTLRHSNPFDKPDEQRMLWALGLDVPVAAPDESIELLYWIGCAGSFDPDGQAVAKAMVKILNHLGVNYHVLGKRERCTGDPARRLGEEGLFQELAKQNIQLLDEHKVTTVLTHCPHCLNTIANEYPALGGKFKVVHHTEFLSEQISQGRLDLPHAMDQTVTFHDPCYLGRGNGKTAAPREALMSLPQLNLVEMPRHGEQSFCCGAGGGSMWLDVKGDARIENLRAQEAADTGADVVATACPFCKTMLESAETSGTGVSLKKMIVKDIAQLIVEAQGL